MVCSHYLYNYGLIFLIIYFLNVSFFLIHHVDRHGVVVMCFVWRVQYFVHFLKHPQIHKSGRRFGVYNRSRFGTYIYLHEHMFILFMVTVRTDTTTPIIILYKRTGCSDGYVLYAIIIRTRQTWSGRTWKYSLSYSCCCSRSSTVSQISSTDSVGNDGL